MVIGCGRFVNFVLYPRARHISLRPLSSAFPRLREFALTWSRGFSAPATQAPFPQARSMPRATALELPFAVWRAAHNELGQFGID